LVNGGGAELALSAGMRVQPPLPVLCRGNQPVSVTAVAASGKASNSAMSGRERREAPPAPHREHPHLTIALVCQGGTKTDDPFRDGPCLVPAFVTQLLGQAMAGEQRRAPRLVYGAAVAKTALLLDTRA
jgi:hypothetical protein